MRRRLLNIASIVCLVACVVLMGMWVRSYLLLDQMSIHVFKNYVGVASEKGRLCFDVTRDVSGPLPLAWLSTRVWNHPLVTLGKLGFYFDHNAQSASLYLPYWFVVSVSGSLAMAFQLCWPLRFKLRGMFVLTTFLAIVLGMIAWLDRALIGK